MPDSPDGNPNRIAQVTPASAATDARLAPVAAPQVGPLAGLVDKMPAWLKVTLAVLGTLGGATAVVVSSVATAGIALPAWAAVAGTIGGSVGAVVGSLGLLSSGPTPTSSATRGPNP